MLRMSTCRGSSEPSTHRRSAARSSSRRRATGAGSSTHYRYAKEQVEHSLVYAYRDRKVQEADVPAALDHADQRRRPRRTGCRTTSSSTAAARPASSSTARCSRTSPSAIPAAFGAIAEQAKAALAESDAGLITSRDNERLKLVRKLHDRRWRDKLGLFVAEGEDLVEAAAAGIEPVDLLVAGEDVAAGAARRGVDARASAARDRRLPARRPAARRAAGDARALARRRSGERRHAAPLGRRVRRRRRALGRAAPTRPARRRCARRWARSSACRSRRFDEPSGRRIALVPRGGTPLPELELDGDVVFVLGAEREGLPDEVLERCDVRSVDPADRRRGVAERRDGRHGRAVRAARGADAAQKEPGPVPGPDQSFTEPVSLSSASSNRPFASGLPPLRRTARSRFRPSRAPCSVQEGTYEARAHRIKTRAANNFVAICGRSSSARDPDGVLAAGVRPPVEPAVARRRPRSRPRRAARASAPARATTASSSTRPPGRARTASASARSRSQSARSSMPGSRSIQRPCVSSMSSRDGAKTSKTSRPPGRSSSRAARERLEPLLVVAQVEVRAERARDERDALVDRRPAQVAEPQVEPVRDAGLRARSAQTSSIPARRVDADHVHARRARSGSRCAPCRRRARRPAPPAASASST